MIDLKNLDYQQLDRAFISSLPEELAAELLLYRQQGKEGKELSVFLIELAKYLEEFLYSFFKLNSITNNQDAYLLVEVKRQFIQRKVANKYKDLNEIAVKDTLPELNLDFELEFCRFVKSASPEQLEELEKIAAYILFHPNYKEARKESVLFHLPKKYSDFYFDFSRDEDNAICAEHSRFRYGFNLTDEGKSNEYVVDQTNYCIFCHNQQKDSCSKGISDKNGCPLDEKISEMNFLKFHKHHLAALAMALRDNPMMAATGHRICNDCMKACIYQKQEPVDIPQIETRVMEDILSMEYGFELYNLLIMWNPLMQKDYLPGEKKNQKILIVGLGPAGFSLAHYLSRQGFQIIAIDGLKISPLDKIFLDPIKNIEEFFVNLSVRDSQGFGGVMEYGITNRWNKNYLTLIRILLERRDNVKIIGGVRLGSNITIDQAKELGINHIALCTGAGKPNIPGVKDVLVRGVKTASDFLMNLQSGSTFKFDSLNCLQIRMPIVVIGGGLTAIDAATEAAAYYLIQIEKFLQDYSDKIILDEEEQIFAAEFITHARLAREELKKDTPNLLGLLNSFGGVKILYRKELKDSPAYKNNHEEVEKALEEGIKFYENIELESIICNKFGALEKIVTRYKKDNLIEFNAGTMLLAIGTSPNITLAEEESDYLSLDNIYYQNAENPFFAYKDKDFSISFFGDAHPKFAGNVVKALASSKKGYHYIEQDLENKVASGNIKIIKEMLEAIVEDVIILTPNIVEVVIKSPLAAKNFQPGQFFKLQFGNFEPLALTGAGVNRETGVISLIILEMGGTSSLCRFLKKGQKVCLMGPTGMPTEITDKDKNILLVGGGLGNAVLFSIGQKARSMGVKVTYFAAYKKGIDICKQEEIEKSADQIIWCCEEAVDLNIRVGDSIFKGNIVEALNSYYANIYDRTIVIGSAGMMKAVHEFLHTHKSCSNAICSVNSPMQCMMKEICAQCLQKHFDHETGLETYVYSCKNQDQQIDKVDFNHLISRLKQNSLLEKIIKNKIPVNNQKYILTI